MEEVTRYNAILMKKSDPSVCVSYAGVSGFSVSNNMIHVEIETGAIQVYSTASWSYIVTEYKIKVKLPPV